MRNIILPEVSCTTAKEFLEALSPIGDIFSKMDMSSPWLFRGQGKDYPLVPSLFRQNGKLKSLTDRSVENYRELLLAERDILIEFFRIADKRGLVLPDDSQELRRSLEEINSLQEFGNRLDSVRITDSGLSLMALAQHYGVPTRLLDWTLSPYTAAFFAAEDAAAHDASQESEDKLVVWSFYFPNYGKQYIHGNAPYLIRVLTAPSASNPNLKAQQGVFTLFDTGSTEEQMGNYRYKPFDEILAYYAEGGSPEAWLLECKLQKFTLPASQAHVLLFLLAKLDITPSSIYPGYQHIVDDLKNKISCTRNVLNE